MTTQDLKNSLERHTHASPGDWQRFVNYLLLVLGCGFCTAGIVFFFAYNWTDLPKFAKIGIAEGLLTLSTLLALIYFRKPILRSIILTVASLMVGVLFAVFGQIYQTGADAYDFFLAWTLFISIWVIISSFAPLTLLYVILINTTFILYSNQVAKDWNFEYICTLLFALNTTIAIGSLYLKHMKKVMTAQWLIQTLSLTAIAFLTLTVIYQIMEQLSSFAIILSPLYIVTIGAAIWFSRRMKSTFYLAAAAFSLIISVSAILMRYGHNDIDTFLFLSLFIVVSVTATVKYLIYIQRKWNHDQ
ncbi:DUF2157 domain-containing protein [Sphingobacterium sp. SGG-5]|nr:DUF2157 domain-containing protein [Sphingobacterium sp. SGG-5]